MNRIVKLCQVLSIFYLLISSIVCDPPPGQPNGNIDVLIHEIFDIPNGPDSYSSDRTPDTPTVETHYPVTPPPSIQTSYSNTPLPQYPVTPPQHQPQPQPQPQPQNPYPSTYENPTGPVTNEMNPINEHNVSVIHSIQKQ